MNISEIPDGNDVETRRKKVFDRLNARHSNKATSSAKPSQESFGPKELEAIQIQIKIILSDPNAKVDPAFLQKVESALSLLPSGFELRRLRDLHGQLRARLQQDREPASVFSFMSKLQRSKPVDDSLQNTENTPVEKPSSTILRSKESRIVSNLKNERLRLQGTDGEDIAIMDVTDSKIVADFKASTVHLKAVRNSVIILAPVHSSVMIRDCSELTVVVAAQQIRIHSSRNLCLHIAVRGAVILEDCEGIKVAPYRVKTVKLGWSNDNWKEVKDFDWLTAEDNPHWGIMEEDSWKTFDFNCI